MAETIKVNPEQLRELSQQFKACSEQNTAMANKLKTLVDGMEGEWKGVSQERFYESFKDAHTKFEQVTQLLNDVAAELGAIAERFRVVDESYQG